MMDSIVSTYWWAVQTPLLLSAWALLALIMEMAFWKKNPKAMGYFALAGLVAILAVQILLHVTRINLTLDQARAFGGQYYFDVYSIFFNYIFLIAAIVTVVQSLTHFQDSEDHEGAYYVLVLLAAVGMCMMAGAHNLLILFIGLEIMSISVYILVGIQRRSLRSGEASIKYLLLGAFSSGVLLYGMALLWGTTGALDYQLLNVGISEALNAGRTANLTVMAGVLLLLCGLFFKVAAVPFHMWTPDVYEGAPTPITAYMATGVKAAAFAALIRLGYTSFKTLWGLESLFYILWTVAAVTMTMGNVVAIAQKNVKRMLAYSSIAHAGYLLVGVTAIIASGRFLVEINEPTMAAGKMPGEIAQSVAYFSTSSVIFYLLIYALTNLGAFGVLTVLGRQKNGSETLDGLSGLAKKRPGLAAAMAVFMLSLAGIPPLAGFAAKFYVFQGAIQAGLYWLAIIGVLNSAVSAYYYLRVLVVMYMSEEEVPFAKAAVFTGASAANVVMGALVIMVGVFPQPLLNLLVEFFKTGMIELVVR